MYTYLTIYKLLLSEGKWSSEQQLQIRNIASPLPIKCLTPLNLSLIIDPVMVLFTLLYPYDDNELIT